MGPTDGPATAEQEARPPWAARAAPALRYALAAGAVLAAFAVKRAFPQLFGPPYLLFYPAVAGAAVLGGLGPALLATGLSALLAAAYILPAGSPEGLQVRDMVGLAVFTSTGLILAAVAHRLREARDAEALRRHELAADHDRRRAEEALRASEERLRLFVDHAPAAVAMFDRRMCYLAVSRRFVTDYRLPDGDLLGRSHYDVFPEIPERWREIHRRCLAGAVERCEEDPFPRPDGTIDWVRWEIRPWWDSSGQIGGVVLFSEDITRRKRDEQARRESEARYRVIFDQAAVGVALVESATNRFLEVNARYCEILGYPREALVGRTWADITHPDELETDRARVRHMLQTGEPYRREKRYVHRDGTVVWGSLTVSPVAMPGSSITTQVAMLEDVTERHRAAEALRQSAERFRAIFEKVAVGMAELDARTGTYLRVNDAYCAIVGFPREELLRMGWPDITHPDDVPADRAAVARLLAEHGSFAREKRYRRKDGATVWVRLTTSPVWPAGSEPTTLVSVVEDITAQRRLEEQLRQAQKLESIGRLAGGVAHDFNNLLTVILGCTTALRDDLDAGRAVDPVELGEIQAAGRRAAELTRQLLAFARRQAVEPVALDLGAVVQRSERLLRRVLGEDVELTVTAPASPWLVRCDPGQVEQVILNLAVNARDAMPGGGKLSIAVDHVDAAAGHDALPAGAAAGSWVRLTARDTGVGMPEEVRAHLFEPFFTTKPVGKGTGLGLATVYGIVAQSGGHLRVESAPGRGSSFEIWLPRTEESPAPDRPATEGAPGGSESVLVVEDDPAVRHVIGRLLADAGYQVRLAAGPHEALGLPDEALAQVRLLVTDVVMPGVDGRRLADALLRRHPGLKVLFVSGHAGDALDGHGGAGGGAFLAKPFTGPALLRQARAILDG